MPFDQILNSGNRYRSSKMRVLLEIRQYLSDNNHWVKGHVAVDANGDSVAPKDGDVVAVCMIGAIEKFSKSPHEATNCLNMVEETIVDFIKQVVDQKIGAGVPSDEVSYLYKEIKNKIDMKICVADVFNDHPLVTHADILEILDRVIMKLDAVENPHAAVI